jgi:hypothetical protein
MAGFDVPITEPPFPEDLVILQDDGGKARDSRLNAQRVEVTLKQEKWQGLRTKTVSAEEHSGRYNGQHGQPEARGHENSAEVE